MITSSGKKILIVIVLICLFAGCMVLLRTYETALLPGQTDVQEKKALLMIGDAERGRHLTRECLFCHTLDEDGPARLGPNLFGIVGSHHAHMNGYSYSRSLTNMHDRIWTPEALDKWLSSPTAYAPDTKMAFPGFVDPQDRADIIAYLKTLKN